MHGSPLPLNSPATHCGITDAAAFGFSPEASGLTNARALQEAVDLWGTVVIRKPGAYRLAATVFLGSHTALIFGHGVIIEKADEEGPFTHVLSASD